MPVAVLLTLTRTYSSFSLRLKTFNARLTATLVGNLEPLTRYYVINNNVWQDGFLIDFVQKKIADKWIRKFLIISSYLFNERVLFTFAVKFYNLLVIWPSTTRAVFEFSNVSLMLHATTTALLLITTSLNLLTLFALFL